MTGNKHEGRHASIAWVVIAVAAVLGAASGFAEDSTSRTDQLIGRLTAADADWDERSLAESLLLRMPPEATLIALVPWISKPMPDGPIWNSGGADIDREAPTQWQIHYAIRRVWEYHLPKATPAVTRAMVALLHSRNISPIVSELSSGVPWDSEAEDAVLAQLTGARLRSGKLAAAYCLIARTGLKYRDDLVRLAKVWPRAPWQETLNAASLVQKLLETKAEEKDRELMKLGFELLTPLEAAAPGTGYFLAVDLELYTGATFRPDQNDARFQHAAGLSPAFFTETVRAAQEWWKGQQPAQHLRQSSNR